MPKAKKILIVEDSPFMQVVLKKIITKLNHSCDIISSGAQAIDAICTENYDLILLDCQLPILSGYEISAEIRDREKKGILKRKNIIIACTANAMEGDKERCIEAGMNDHIVKPVTETLISSILHKWLKD